MGRVVRGRARERSAFSPSGGNEAKRTLRGRSDSEESVTPVFVRDRNTPSVTFGDSSLREGAKDEGCGFDRLRPQNDRVGAWFFFVWGATTRRAKRPRMATAGGRRPPQLVEKAYFGFFYKLLTFLISSKKFLTTRESGGSPVSVWLCSKASGLPPAVLTPFHTFPPWLVLRGATFSTA